MPLDLVSAGPLQDDPARKFSAIVTDNASRFPVQAQATTLPMWGCVFHDRLEYLRSIWTLGNMQQYPGIGTAGDYHPYPVVEQAVSQTDRRHFT
jgi:hypothetical protein